jgi:carbonic anhydrase
VDEAALEPSAVADPYTTVKADVEVLLGSALLPPGIGVSDHVYDVETGHSLSLTNRRDEIGDQITLKAACLA